MGFNHLASFVTKVLIRKLSLQAFFWSTTLHRDVQPLPVKGARCTEKVRDDFFSID
jgi:hypothetical protein